MSDDAHVVKLSLVEKIKLMKNTKIHKILKPNKKLGFKGYHCLKENDTHEIKGAPYVFYNKPTDNLKFGVKFLPISLDDDSNECKSSFVEFL